MTQNKRRFPRINLGQLASDLKAISDAQIFEIDGERVELDVFDISYDSLAFHWKGEPFKLSQELKLKLRLPGYNEETIAATVVRLTRDMTALKFDALTAEQHLMFESFLKDKMIGVNTYLVSKEFYSDKEDFTHWFHGPNSTNIIAWRSGSGVSKAIFEMNVDILVYENEKWSLTESKRDEKTSRPDEYQIELADAKKSVPRLMFERAFNILSQMLMTVPPHQRTVVQFLSEKLRDQLEGE